MATRTLIYLAFPDSLIFETANSIQTYWTLQALYNRLHDRLVAILPRQRGQPSLYDELNCVQYTTRMLPYKDRSGTARGWPTYLHRSLFAVRALLMAGTWRNKLVYVRDPVVAFWCLVAARTMGLQYVVEVHQLESQNRYRPPGSLVEAIIARVEPAVLRGAKKVVTLTNVFADHLSNRFGIRNVEVIPDGYPSGMRCPHQEAVGVDQHTVVYAGLTFAGRRVETLISAFPGVQSAHPQASLLILGGQPNEYRLLRAAHEGSSIAFPGRLPQCCVQRVLEEAGVLVIPGVVDALSSSPLKLFEYMAARRPIVCSNYPSLREVLGDHSAYFFDPNSPTDLAEKIVRALDECPRGAAKPHQVAAAFSYDARANRIIRAVGL